MTDSCSSHSDSLISLSYAMPAFSANSFGLFRDDSEYLLTTFYAEWPMLCCTKFLLLLLAISKRHKKKLNMAEKGGVVPWCSALQWVLIETGGFALHTAVHLSYVHLTLITNDDGHQQHLDPPGVHVAPPWGLLVLPIGHISSMSVQHWTSESWILESGEVALVMGLSPKLLMFF